MSIVEQLRADGIVTVAEWDAIRANAAIEIERLLAVCKDKTTLLDAAYAIIETRDKMLRQKDEAMGTLFGLLDKAGVDYSNLLS